MHSDQYSRIFLLSHMRAYTSLLGHILGSHPEINGYFEMHISYRDPAALHMQIEKLRRHETLKDNSRYLFDKLLHNRYCLMLDQLGLDDVKILVALREPKQSIKSIVNLFLQKGTDHPYAQPEAAAGYYIDRIRSLAEFCNAFAGRYYYFDAEPLRKQPATLLSALAGWLDLEVPLSAHYHTFSQTGKARKGDSSERIRSGKIDTSESDYSLVTIQPDALQQASTIYQEGRRGMIANAIDCFAN
jgi:hypothetical protein